MSNNVNSSINETLKDYQFYWFKEIADCLYVSDNTDNYSKAQTCFMNTEWIKIHLEVMIIKNWSDFCKNTTVWKNERII